MVNETKFAVIALGANLLNGDNPNGETFITLRELLVTAIGSITDKGESVGRTSKFYRTPAFPEGSGPDYVNAVIEVQTKKSPEELLTSLHQIEKEFGRMRVERWGPRTLDLDILSFENNVLPDMETYKSWVDLPIEQQQIQAPEQLILPHPRLHERAFVLVPLADAVPEWSHPVSGESAQTLLDQLPESARSGIIPL